MRYLLIFTILFALQQAQAQTKPIAYKSHAGDMDFFMPDKQPQDDFGNPPPRILKIVKINDSTIVEVMSEWGTTADYTDTVVNHPHFKDPNVNLEEVKEKYRYNENIEFIGFDTENPKPIKKKGKKGKEKEDNQPKACPVPKDSIKGAAIEPSDRAEWVVLASDSNQQPPQSTSHLGIIWAAAIAYLFLLGFLVWKRQRERLLPHAG